MKTAIVWFRRDLRLHNNPALDWACEHCDAILPVYIHAPDEEAPWQPGGASRWWLDKSLRSLQIDLKKHGLELQCYSGNSSKILGDLMNSANAQAVVFNRLYEPHLHKRDEVLIKALSESAIEIRAFDVGLFFKPGTVLNNQGLPYRVYTPFSKKVRSQLHNIDTSHSDRIHKLKSSHAVPMNKANSIDDLKLNDTFDWHAKLQQYWQPGEQQALLRIHEFLEHGLCDYDHYRDIPSIDGTSALSAHLHFGEITIEQIYSLLLPYLDGQFGNETRTSAERYLNQLIWREFAHHILWHYPHTANRSMDARYTASFWKKPGKKFKQWTRGETGTPIIDAGMKQLWETGWMHNRVRMIVASYLTKNLGYHWLDGAKWFWDTLVDADLANNSMGWQWVAGCGVDAAPYYRIFNPLTQTKRFDADLDYVRHWVPESFELDYPPPIIDLDETRQDALFKYKQFFSTPQV